MRTRRVDRRGLGFARGLTGLTGLTRFVRRLTSFASFAVFAWGGIWRDLGFACLAAFPRGGVGFVVLGSFAVLCRGGSVVTLNDLVGQRGNQIDDRPTLRTAVGATLRVTRPDAALTSFANRFRIVLLHVMEPMAPLDSTGKKLMIASKIVRTTLKPHRNHVLPQEACHSSGW